MFKGSVVAALLCACAAGANAQVRDVSLTTVRTGDWVFVPTTLDGHVESLVGLRDAGTAIGDNIRSVWIHKDENGKWACWGWPDVDQGKPIALITEALGLPALCNAKWPVLPSTVLADEPEKLIKGIGEGDPLMEAVLESEDPKAFVQFVEQMGWKAAWLPIFNFKCEPMYVVDAWVAAIDSKPDQPESFDTAVAAPLLASGCTAPKVNEQIVCWMNEFWYSFDQGKPIDFNGVPLGIDARWDPFSCELIPKYRELHPEVPLSALTSRAAWDALAPAQRADFRAFALNHSNYETASIFRPGQRTTPNPTPIVTPPATEGCDHAAFRAALEAALNTQKPWSDAYDCLYEDEGWTDVITRDPFFDCDDFADTIGTCIANTLRNQGFDVTGRNKKILIRNYHWYGYSSVGHVIYAIFFCGHWYILEQDTLIGIEPGTIDSIPIGPGPADRLRPIVNPEPGDDVRIVPGGEWDPNTRPFWEGPPWYESDRAIQHVIDCLRANGLTDAQILALLSCGIPASYIPNIEYRLTHPYVPPSATPQPCHRFNPRE